MENMFCFQCEQTAFGQGCEKGGVCGKSIDVANLQDDLTSRLIELGKDVTPSDELTELLIDGLFTTITNVSFDEKSLKEMTERVMHFIPQYVEIPFDVKALWTDDKDIRSLKSLVLFGLKGIAAYAHHARVLGYKDKDVDNFFYESLNGLSRFSTVDELLPLVLKTGEINLKCMELLNNANVESYGRPEPTCVQMKIEKGPFIIISGHDLKDLALLLEQTKGTGVHIYTHGEMLPAHAYPLLNKFDNLKGNFGTAWQNQQNEFADVPAPVLFTTNCIMPVKESYEDRIFTTSVVQYPKMEHIGKEKDFTPVIRKAFELGGYLSDKDMYGINGGAVLTTGFGKDFMLSLVDKIVENVKSGAIKHFYLVGGCDGAKVGRNYYTDFVKAVPENSIVITLACGKYRFNDLDLGEINGIPRLVDMGQCNDAYGAVQLAVALAKEFDCSVNELPLTFILSWYEQKAVAILLTLLYLGIKGIKLGPSLPAFISPNVLDILVEKFKIAPISTVDADLNTNFNQ